MPIDVWRYDTIEAAHGRPVATAVGVKMARPANPVIAYLGDGAAYSIGIAETIHSARRNDNITVIVLNNCVFGMTGGRCPQRPFRGR
ncbi:MAG: thiamine pyrophosphate-dependent enzyme [Blautia marasmi]